MTKVQATLFVMSVVLLGAGVGWAVVDGALSNEGTRSMIFYVAGLVSGLSMAAVFASGRAKS